MKATLSILVVISFLSFASCTKDGAFTIEQEPASQLMPMATTTTTYKPTEEGEEIQANLQGDTTIQLQVSRAIIDSGANEFRIAGTDNAVSMIESLTAYQDLTFTDSNNQTISHTLEVKSFNKVSTNMEVTFDMGATDLSALTIITSQNIVIEDIIVN